MLALLVEVQIYPGMRLMKFYEFSIMYPCEQLILIDNKFSISLHSYIQLSIHLQVSFDIKKRSNSFLQFLYIDFIEGFFVLFVIFEENKQEENFQNFRIPYGCIKAWKKFTSKYYCIGLAFVWNSVILRCHETFHFCTHYLGTGWKEANWDVATSDQQPKP